MSDRSKVDKFKLDDECCEQSSLYMAKAKLASKAAEIKDLYAKALDRIRAKTELDIRKKFKEIKEGEIKARIILDPFVVKAERLYIRAKRLAKDADAEEISYRQRKGMIERLAELWLGAYWSDISVNLKGTARDIASQRKEELAQADGVDSFEKGD